MKITLAKAKQTITVHKVTVGNVFSFNGEYFIRVDSSIISNTKKAVNLSTGVLIDLENDTLVEEVDAKLIIN